MRRLKAWITSDFRSSVAWCGSPNSLLTFWNSSSARLRGRSDPNIYIWRLNTVLFTAHGTPGESNKPSKETRDRVSCLRADNNHSRRQDAQRRDETVDFLVLTPQAKVGLTGAEWNFSYIIWVRLVCVCVRVGRECNWWSTTNKTDTDSWGFIKRTILLFFTWCITNVTYSQCCAKTPAHSFTVLALAWHNTCVIWALFVYWRLQLSMTYFRTSLTEVIFKIWSHKGFSEFLRLIKSKIIMLKIHNSMPLWFVCSMN